MPNHDDAVQHGSQTITPQVSRDTAGPANYLLDPRRQILPRTINPSRSDRTSRTSKARASERLNAHCAPAQPQIPHSQACQTCPCSATHAQPCSASTTFPFNATNTPCHATGTACQQKSPETHPAPHLPEPPALAAQQPRYKRNPTAGRKSATPPWQTPDQLQEIP